MKELVEKYPHVFKLFYTGAEKGKPFHGCQVWGFECGSGWKDIIEECASKIESEILKMPEENREHFYAVQIKEKYGTLRFYMSGQTDEMDEAIRSAGQKSSETCELCGKPGKLIGERWLSTRCENC